MLKSMSQKVMVRGGILLLCVAAFLAGGIVLNSAHASSNTVQSGTMIKGGFHVLHMQGQDIQATVLGASSDALKKGATVTIHTNASTAYQRDGIAVSSVTITPGSDIAAGGTLNSDGSITAIVIATGNLGGGKNGHNTCGALQTATFSGTVTAIHENVLTVVDGMNGYRYNPSCNSFERGTPLTFTVTTNAHTQIVQAKSSTTSLSDIKVGMQITVEGTRASDGTTIKADRIEVVPPYMIGKIVNISGSTLTLESGLTVHVDANTKVLNKAKPQGFGLADLKVGDTIFATGTRNSDGSLNATMVIYLGPYPQSTDPKAGK